MMAAVPAMGVSELLDTDVSTRRGPEGQAHYEAYEKKIQDLKADIPMVMLAIKDGKISAPPTAGEEAKWASIKKSASELTTQILLDGQISEADIRNLYYSYQKELYDAVPLDRMEHLSLKAAFIEEARAEAAADPRLKGALPDDVAKTVSRIAGDKSDLEFWLTLFAMLGSYEFFRASLRRGLEDGRRRDDENIREEKREKLIAAKEDLENLLKPKSPRPPGK
jgi:hypothetical protein